MKFNIGDKVRYIGPTNSNLCKWLYGRPGIIDKISIYRIRVKYEKNYRDTLDNKWWFDIYELKFVIPEYIRIWKKRLLDV